MKKFFKHFRGNRLAIFFGLMLILLLAGLTLMIDSYREYKYINYSTFLEYINNNQISSIEISGYQANGKLANEARFYTTLPMVADEEASVYKKLKENNVSINNVVPSSDNNALYLIWASILAISALLIWFFLRQAKNLGNSGGSNNIFGVNKSKAKMILPSQMNVNFDSVAGIPEAKEELEEVIEFLKNPEKFQKLGAKIPKGILLTGEPGNGKTLLAKAVAGEANCTFFSISGSDFIEVFVGVGAGRVRDLFAQARKHAPCIIFIDEIDSIGKQRTLSASGGNDERDQTLNQLLTEMDGFETEPANIIVIGATNRSDILDKALLRPGRFDRKVHVPYPEINSRYAILKVHAKNIVKSKDVDLHKVARGTVGFTGADLANLLNEAALNAVQTNKNSVTMEDIDAARDKMILGKERKGTVQTQEELEVVAYHEAGHALIRLLIPDYTDPLYKVTILPRGQALGVTHYIPEKDRHSYSKEQYEADIMSALGGRAAEELVFNKLETGAYSDFQKATDMLRRMICYYGMSKKLGTIVYNRSEEYQYSEETAKLIDTEMRDLMAEYYNKALHLLTKNREKLDILAKTLLEKETLFAEEIYPLLSIEPRETHNILE